jgi:chromatin segregation and condensation protein Rec8/ScpA/Scc1 (kleisin family)
MVDILQTLGICIGAAALVVIAFSMFMIASTFTSLPADVTDMLDEEEDDEFEPDIERAKQQYQSDTTARSRRKNR